MLFMDKFQEPADQRIPAWDDTASRQQEFADVTLIGRCRPTPPSGCAI